MKTDRNGTKIHQISPPPPPTDSQTASSTRRSAPTVSPTLGSETDKVDKSRYHNTTTIKRQRDNREAASLSHGIAPYIVYIATFTNLRRYVCTSGTSASEPKLPSSAVPNSKFGGTSTTNSVGSRHTDNKATKRGSI